MPSTIAVLSQKGGTGKTTTVRTLTDVFRRAGLAVLAVDLDPQGNLSDYLDVPPDADPTVGDVLTGRVKAAAAVHNGVIPANLGLAEAELALGGKMGRELTLKRAIREVSADYDLVLIDCPPALGLLTVNALVASDYALLSAEAQYFALQGVEQALQVIELAKDSLNPDLEWLGVVLNIADMRTRHSREAFDSLREHFGDKLLDTTIRASIAYAESAERARLDPRLPARPRRRLPARGRRAAAPARAQGRSQAARAVAAELTSRLRQRLALAGPRSGPGGPCYPDRPAHGGWSTNI